MLVSARKKFWWLILFLSAGPLIWLAFVLAYCIATRSFPGDFRILVIWFFAEIFTTVLSSVMLRRCHALAPFPAPGRWQLSLSDLLSVTIFCACTMLFMKGFTSITDFRELSHAVIWLPLTAGFGYTISLLAVARYIDPPEGFEKWAMAFSWMLLTLCGLFFGAVVKYCLVGALLVGLFRWH